MIQKCPKEKHHQHYYDTEVCLFPTVMRNGVLELVADDTNPSPAGCQMYRHVQSLSKESRTDFLKCAIRIHHQLAAKLHRHVQSLSKES
jgi:hypothetical protein